MLIARCLSAQTYAWSNLPGAPYNGSKQDGISFIHPDTGWVVNGSGKIYRTTNGGSNWQLQHNSPGTYFRAVAFMNSQVGFAGNVGTNYYPGVTDTNPLYKTINGGVTWSSVTASVSGTMPTGICAIQVVDANTIYAAGRVGGPAVLLKSTDGGNTWTGSTLPAPCKMILDLRFFSADTGYVFAGNNTNVPSSNALIMRTVDGGNTWSAVYTSTRPYEMIWKTFFPSRNTGYATILSYDMSSAQRYVTKTTDGGLTWTELPLVNTTVKEFGIGFINDSTGWVGGESTGYQTLDGGLSWTPKNIGQYANKIVVTNGPGSVNTCYAVGLNVFKLTTGSVPTAIASVRDNNAQDLMVYPNPAKAGSYVGLSVDKTKSEIVKCELIDSGSKAMAIVFDTFYKGTREGPFTIKLPEVEPGLYMLKFTMKDGKTVSQKIAVEKKD